MKKNEQPQRNTGHVCVMRVTGEEKKKSRKDIYRHYG